MMEKRLIKKYPNRRLYDTQESRYITLEDVRALVLKQQSFQVLDARTKEDLTNNILLQIVMELEQKGAPIFTGVMLEQLIRLYGNQFQNVFSDFLEKNMSLFRDPSSSQEWFKNFSAQQMQWWQNWQQQWQGWGKGEKE